MTGGLHSLGGGGGRVSGSESLQEPGLRSTERGLAALFAREADQTMPQNVQHRLKTVEVK